MKPRICVLSETLEDNGNSYSALHRHSWERCEFCDVLFDNRYTMLKHNLSHIIIPLIKQKTFRCDECLYHFTSVADLESHSINKHGRLKTDDYRENLPEILQSIIEKQVYVKCEDELKDVFDKRSKIKRNSTLSNIEPKTNEEPIVPHIKTEAELLEPTQSEEPLQCLDSLKPNLKDEPLSPPTDEEKEPIRQRLLFEEDIDDTLFKDLSADCKVSLETLYDEINPTIDILQTFNGLSFERSGSEDLLSKAQEETTDLLRFGKAIHYDVLLEKEVCFCRLCGRDFPNRYTLLQHEPTHITMKVKRFRSPPLCCICERYISGNYRNMRRHRLEKHPEQEKEIHHSTDKCPKCHLTFHNYRRHLRYHHNLYKCSLCDVEFESQVTLNGHDCCPKSGRKVKVIEEKVSTDSNVQSVMKLCDMCFSFMKIYMQNRQNYEEIGEKSELGIRQTCDKCNNKFFEVKLVRRKPVVKDHRKDRVKPLTNQQRLKKLQSRFKMIKNRNKF